MLYEIPATVIILVAFFISLYVAMNKGSPLTQTILGLSWEDIVVILGAIMSLISQLSPFIPNMPAWLPIVIAIIIKAIKDMHTSTVQAKAKISRGI